MSKQPPIVDNKNGLVCPSENPLLAKVMDERRHHVRRPQDLDPSIQERIALKSRVLIVEGISGSGKDTFQKYLKSKLRSRVVYDYSEGEFLWSWKHQQIKDIYQDANSTDEKLPRRGAALGDTGTSPAESIWAWILTIFRSAAMAMIMLLPIDERHAGFFSVGVRDNKLTISAPTPQKPSHNAILLIGT